MQALRSTWLPVVLGGTVVLLLLQQQFLSRPNGSTHVNGGSNGNTLTHDYYMTREHNLVAQIARLNDTLKTIRHQSSSSDTELLRAQDAMTRINHELTREQTTTALLRAQIKQLNETLDDLKANAPAGGTNHGKGKSSKGNGDDANVDICAAYAKSSPMDVPLYCQPIHTVIAGYDKDVTSLFQRLTEDGRPYTYYNHKDQDHADYLGPNKGDEAHPFLRFVIDHYDHLPQTVALIQDDAMAQALPGINHMKCLKPSPSLPYTTLITCYAPWGIFDRPNFVRLVEAFGATSMKPLPPDGQKLYYNCCAYFAVGREHILRHSKAAWRRSLEFMNRYSTGTHTIGLVWEHAWHAIFGDDWAVLDIENNLNESCHRYQPNCTYMAADTNFCKLPHKKQGQ